MRKNGLRFNRHIKIETLKNRSEGNRTDTIRKLTLYNINDLISSLPHLKEYNLKSLTLPNNFFVHLTESDINFYMGKILELKVILDYYNVKIQFENSSKLHEVILDIIGK